MSFYKALKELSITINISEYLSCSFRLRHYAVVRWIFEPLVLACDEALVSFSESDL